MSDYKSPFGQKCYAQGELIPWEQDELEQLKVMWMDRKFQIRDICNKLSRSRGSVCGKARALGLIRPPKSVSLP